MVSLSLILSYISVCLVYFQARIRFLFSDKFYFQVFKISFRYYIIFLFCLVGFMSVYLYQIFIIADVKEEDVS